MRKHIQGLYMEEKEEAFCGDAELGGIKGMLKKIIGVVHVIAKCEDCGKEFQNYKNGQALAAKHAKDHKHKVRGEIGLAFVYDGRN